jgi:hypothetical protein
MSNQVIVFTDADGQFSMCIPTGELPIEEVQQKDIPKDCESFIVDVANLPANANDFFEAWQHIGSVVTINLAKAKEITKARLRIERAPLLIEQDIAFQRALETNASTETIIEEKQRLRHLPELADQCQSIEELRALTAKK